MLVGCTAKQASTDPASTVPAPASLADSPSTPITPAAPDCHRDPFSTWPACESQPVQIRGTNPQHVHQHPLLAAPSVDGQPAEHQGYLDVPDVGQIIVLTRAPFECPAGMIATGTLRRIEAKVDKAVKSLETYGGWVLEGATVECE